MTNMLEQVAMVLRVTDALIKGLEADGHESDAYVGKPFGPIVLVDGRFDFSVLARAAIEALRNPTEEMVNEGIETVCECGHTNHGARDTFIAMIDEALRDPTDKTQERRLIVPTSSRADTQ